MNGSGSEPAASAGGVSAAAFRMLRRVKDLFNMHRLQIGGRLRPLGVAGGAGILNV